MSVLDEPPDWFIPARYLQRSNDEDYGKRMPMTSEFERMAWILFTTRVNHVYENCVPGSNVYVPTTQLTEKQIECALRDLRAQMIPVERYPGKLWMVVREWQRDYGETI